MLLVDCQVIVSFAAGDVGDDGPLFAETKSGILSVSVNSSSVHEEGPINVLARWRGTRVGTRWGTREGGGLFPVTQSRSLLRGCWGWAGPAAPRGGRVAGSLEKEEMPSVGVSLPLISLASPQHLAILVVTVSLALTVPQGQHTWGSREALPGLADPENSWTPGGTGQAPSPCLAVAARPLAVGRRPSPGCSQHRCAWAPSTAGESRSAFFTCPALTAWALAHSTLDFSIF